MGRIKYTLHLKSCAVRQGSNEWSNARGLTSTYDESSRLELSQNTICPTSTCSALNTVVEKLRPQFDMVRCLTTLYELSA